MTRIALYQMYHEVVAEDGTIEERPFFVGDYQMILEWTLWLNEITALSGEHCDFYVKPYGCCS